MRWATRAGVHADQATCAWLIRRFLDPDAEFVFLGNPAEVPADATPFDLADDRFDAPAAVGLDVLIRGLTLTGSSDDATLAITGRLFDGLYEHTRRQLMTGRAPP